MTNIHMMTNIPFNTTPLEDQLLLLDVTHGRYIRIPDTAGLVFVFTRKMCILVKLDYIPIWDFGIWISMIKFLLSDVDATAIIKNTQTSLRNA